MAFSNEQLERYSRHIILKEVGAKGQKKLLNAKVLIIGAGGLGAPCAMYLAAAGVGTIGIADADEVDLSNLQRQIIHSTDDLGKAKVQSAKETMNHLNPDVNVITYRTFVTSENIMDLIKDYDFIIDGTDNFPAKFLINDACVMAKKPFSHAGIIRFKGQLMTYVPGEGPCYRCVFKNPPPKDAVPTCKQAGVIGAMGGVIGSLQAMEAIKYILGQGKLLTGSLLTYDALDMEFRKIKLPKNTCNCAVCGDHPTITELIDYEKAEKTYYINVLITRTDGANVDPFFDALLRVIETEIHRSNCILANIWYRSIFSDDKRCARESIKTIVEQMQQESVQKADGLIVIGKCNKEALLEMRQYYHSVVCVNRNATNGLTDEVVCDGHKIARRPRWSI